jgi:hypothetical protein
MPGHVIIPTIILFFILVTIEAFILRPKLHLTYWKALALSFSAQLFSCVLIVVGEHFGFSTLLEGSLFVIGLPALWLIWWLYAREDLPKPYSPVFLITIVVFLLACFTFNGYEAVWLTGSTGFILSLILPFVYSAVILRVLLKRFYSPSNAWSVSLISTVAAFVLLVFWFVLFIAPDVEAAAKF